MCPIGSFPLFFSTLALVPETYIEIDMHVWHLIKSTELSETNTQDALQYQHLHFTTISYHQFIFWLAWLKAQSRKYISYTVAAVLALPMSCAGPPGSSNEQCQSSWLHQWSWSTFPTPTSKVTWSRERMLVPKRSFWHDFHHFKVLSWVGLPMG